MGKREDLTGQTFNRLLVIEEAFPQTSPIKWVCRCDCGKTIQARGSSLKNGNTKSCGCLQKETTAKRSHVHGARHSRLYSIHTSMLSRCNCVGSSAYSDYGAVGIRVCPEWKNFIVFQQWALNNEYQAGLSLDRIDPAGHYEPSNCRWVTKAIQARNRRANKNSTSSFVGVSWNTQYSKWTATIFVNNKLKYLGRFLNEEDAAKARDAYIRQNKLEGYTLNFKKEN